MCAGRSWQTLGSTNRYTILPPRNPGAGAGTTTGTGCGSGTVNNNWSNHWAVLLTVSCHRLLMYLYSIFIIRVR